MSLKRAVKVLISSAFYSIRALHDLGLRLAARVPRGELIVLYYHSVPDALAERFRRQMNAVARSALVVPADYTGPLNRGCRYIAITFDDALQSVSRNAVPELMKRSLCATIFVPAGVIGRAPNWEMEDGARYDDPVMTADELRSLPSDSITLGCHSVTHPHLTAVQDTQLSEEIDGARTRLEQLLNRPITLFAFPYGAHDDRVIRQCHRAGYTRVFSIVPHRADASGGDYVRGRVPVALEDTAFEFFLKVRGAYAWMPWASAIKRRLRYPARATQSGKSGFHQ